MRRENGGRSARRMERRRRGWEKVESTRTDDGKRIQGEGRARVKWILRMHRLSGMIPRANRYHLPHRKAETPTASPVGTGGSCVFARPGVRKNGFPGARTVPFSGRERFYFRGVARRSVDFDKSAVHHYFRVSQNDKEIRLSRYSRTSRFTISSWWIAQSNRMSIVNPRAPLSYFCATRGMLTSIIVAICIVLYILTIFLYKVALFHNSERCLSVISEKQPAKTRCCVFSMRASVKYVG